ncbi:MAG: hypothetical protein ACJAQW_002178, partial [Paracoccaceae bacterium]
QSCESPKHFEQRDKAIAPRNPRSDPRNAHLTTACIT